MVPPPVPHREQEELALRLEEELSLPVTEELALHQSEEQSLCEQEDVSARQQMRHCSRYEHILMTNCSIYCILLHSTLLYYKLLYPFCLTKSPTSGQVNRFTGHTSDGATIAFIPPPSQ